ncbi:MAG: hypothetical protein HeimC2_45490 [Candidatus Heimdallarchaeota archaeon LC_2]|nr:MAG: hypothetical protein HeimC2_45490 [Candidatus Heimdallarchaeota archaeon LC_2]
MSKDNSSNHHYYKETDGGLTDSWLPNNSRKITIAILNKLPDDPILINQNSIFGTSFLINYKKRIYLITAKHILENLSEKPFYLTFSYIDPISDVPTIFTLKGKDLDGHSLEWHFPKSEYDDFAFLHLCQQELELLTRQEAKVDFGAYVVEKDFGNPLKIKNMVGELTAALGYPEKGTSIYADGRRSFFSQSMISKLEMYDLRNGKIVLRVSTNNPEQPYVALKTKPHGLSGGPIFIRYLDVPERPFSLIGIVTDVTPAAQDEENDNGDVADRPYLNCIKGITFNKILAFIDQVEIDCECMYNTNFD